MGPRRGGRLRAGMRVSNRRCVRALPFVLVVWLCGCDLSALTALSDMFAGGLTGIGISGDTLVAVGDTVRLKAAGSVGGLVGLLSYDPVLDARWSSSDPTIAVVQHAPPSSEDTLYSMVVVRGVRPGTAIIQATARHQTGTFILHVHRAPPPTATTVTRASDGDGAGAIRAMQEQYSNR